MTSETKQARALREIELEVLEEGREWTRRRLEQRLQEEADRQGGVFPPQPAQGASPAKGTMGLRTAVGWVRLEVWHGKDPGDKHWGCPVHERWGLFYLHEQAAHTEGGRGVIVNKRLVRWQGEPVELGQRLHWEAVRGGLGRARNKLVLGDGIPWIWNLKADRWPDARELLDFWHGGEHLWELGRAHSRMDESTADTGSKNGCIRCATGRSRRG